MEIVLFKRLKPVILAGLLLLAVGFLSYSLLQMRAGLDPPGAQRSLARLVTGLEKRLSNDIAALEKRSALLLVALQKKKLAHRDILSREAVIRVDQGKIVDYYGEIYHFEWRDIKVEQWTFITLSQEVFFLKKLAPRTFYVRSLLNLEDNFLTRYFIDRFSYAELLFLSKSAAGGEKDRLDLVPGGMCSYSHTLMPSQDQLRLNLRFSWADFMCYQQKKKGLRLGITLLVCLALLAAFFYRENRTAASICWLGMWGCLFLLATRVGGSNLFLRWGPIGLQSIYQVLAGLVFFLSLVYFFRSVKKPRPTDFPWFNLAVLLALVVSGKILTTVDFIYSSFRLSPAYLALLFSLFLVHLLPLFFLPVKKGPGRATDWALLCLVQFAFVLLGRLVFHVPTFNLVLFGLVPCAGLLFKAGFLRRLIVLFLLALSLFSLLSRGAVLEKKEFIAHNLKNIFLNQRNYAKFIAREMVHEINSRSPSLSDFFENCTTSGLVDIWRQSIARQENIASGIFLVSKEGEVRVQYSYQMPFLRIPAQEFFPFWAIENATAETYGKEVSLAQASVSVYKHRDLLGYIIVQVLDSPRLILRHQDSINIFTIDHKIDGRDLSYIKLNPRNQIVENPSNINLENILGILQHNNRWVRFGFTGIAFSGYIFKDDRNATIIFFPKSSFFKDFSEAVKIFLFLCFFALLFYFRDWQKIDWRAIYYSFSIRVFSILTLISLLTAVIFSLFSLNFHTRASERQLHQVKYESGRTAQNIVANLMSQDVELTQDQLFLISEILNSDISVYDKGVFLDSSNQRRTLAGQVPVFLHSSILDLLDKKNQKFVLGKDGNNLYFKVNDYIFDLEFSYNWQKILSERNYHTDFIITLFFILAVIGFSSAFFSRNRIISPIHELNRAMAEVEKGHLEHLQRIPSEVEIKSLYLGFNSMVEGIRRDKQNISEISRMKTIIKLGRRVAHEVKNPLTPIKLSAEQILSSLKDKNPDWEELVKKSVHFIVDETEHLQKVAFGFLDLSRLDEILAEEFDLLALIKEEVFHFNQIYPRVHFQVKGEEEKYPVFLDKIKIKQVLTNLILNSLEAIGDKNGRIALDLRDHDARLVLEITDNGQGMGPEEIEQIFKIDYSTKDTGSGLGLFIVKRIIDLHGGFIDIRSQKGKGTTVTLDLPRRVRPG